MLGFFRFSFLRDYKGVYSVWNSDNDVQIKWITLCIYRFLPTFVKVILQRQSKPLSSSSTSVAPSTSAPATSSAATSSLSFGFGSASTLSSAAAPSFHLLKEPRWGFWLVMQLHARTCSVMTQTRQVLWVWFWVHSYKAFRKSLHEVDHQKVQHFGRASVESDRWC